jgi:hypothetical protein
MKGKGHIDHDKVANILKAAMEQAHGDGCSALDILAAGGLLLAGTLSMAGVKKENLSEEVDKIMKAVDYEGLAEFMKEQGFGVEKEGRLPGYG